MSLRLGIIGTGRIAKRFVADAKLVDGVEVMSVYNPHAGSAARFAEEQGLAMSFSDLDAFLETVDAVYIASPHGSHYDYAKTALKAGKHVLCEKPMCLSVAEARELFALAEEKGLILQEAIKTAYLPGFQKLLAVAKSGVIGDVVDVESCFTKIEPKTGREFTDTKNGGSVTELGSYVLLPIVKLLGCDYTDVHFQSRRDTNGVDEYTKIILDYGDAMALGKVGLAAKSEGELIVAGTKGYLYCPAPWWLTRHFEVRDVSGKTVETYDFDFQGSGLQYELEAFAGRISGEQMIAMTSEENIASISIIEKFLTYR